jgi:hypothetical protein
MTNFNTSAEYATHVSTNFAGIQTGIKALDAQIQELHNTPKVTGRARNGAVVNDSNWEASVAGIAAASSALVRAVNTSVASLNPSVVLPLADVSENVIPSHVVTTA